MRSLGCSAQHINSTVAFAWGSDVGSIGSMHGATCNLSGTSYAVCTRDDIPLPTVDTRGNLLADHRLLCCATCGEHRRHILPSSVDREDTSIVTFYGQIVELQRYVMTKYIGLNLTLVDLYYMCMMCNPIYMRTVGPNEFAPTVYTLISLMHAVRRSTRSICLS